MPRYTSRKKLKSGVPMGAIGAGKFEVLPNGCIDFITYQNNWSHPISSVPRHEVGKRTAEGLLGYHFGLYVKGKNHEVAKLLQTKKITSFPSVKKIDYKGSFPFATLTYQDTDFPVNTSLKFSSLFAPRDYNISQTPGAMASFHIDNPTHEAYEVSFLIIWRNTIGSSLVGRYNEVERDENGTTLTFRNALDTEHETSYGSFSIAVPGDAGKISYLGEWNLQGKCFEFSESALRLTAWDYFASKGELPNINTREVTQSESYQLGGAIAVKVKVQPGESAEIPVSFSWNFPYHTVGHAYSNRFSDSKDSALYINKNRTDIQSRVSYWYDEIFNMRIPAWLKDALVNNLYPLISSTWWGKNGDFSVYEAPIICPLMGTLDVRYYASIPLALFFPDLECREMLQFAHCQRWDGYVPHDLGKEALDKPSDGTTFFKWKDLGSKFILLAYRDTMWFKDQEFLNAIYPFLVKTLKWQFETDKNGDFLPDNEGQDQTYDLWKFYGTNSYTSSIFLAALLAMEKLAIMKQDEAIAKECRTWFDEGSNSFTRQLWNGQYFIACSGRVKEEACISGQLSGQWYAHLLDLGYIVSKGKVRQSIESIFKWNAKTSKYGLVNSCLPNGKIDMSNIHSKNVWPGQTYAFASLGIYEGYVKESLEIAKKAWENFTKNTLNPWNQADTIDSKNGAHLFGDYYMRSMAIWGILLALGKHDPTIMQGLKRIREKGTHHEKTRIQ